MYSWKFHLESKLKKSWILEYSLELDRIGVAIIFFSWYLLFFISILGKPLGPLNTFSDNSVGVTTRDSTIIIMTKTWNNPFTKSTLLNRLQLSPFPLELVPDMKDRYYTHSPDSEIDIFCLNTFFEFSSRRRQKFYGICLRQQMKRK